MAWITYYVDLRDQARSEVWPKIAGVCWWAQSHSELRREIRTFRDRSVAKILEHLSPRQYIVEIFVRSAEEVPVRPLQGDLGLEAVVLGVGQVNANKLG